MFPGRPGNQRDAEIAGSSPGLPGWEGKPVTGSFFGDLASDCLPEPVSSLLFEGCRVDKVRKRKTEGP